jgi:hypothetical protein
VTPGAAVVFAQNLVGQPLAHAIWFSKSQVRDARPIPPDIYGTLAQAGVAPWVMQKARYSCDWGATANGTIQQVLLGNEIAGAVTLDDIIIFRDCSFTSDHLLWAHELRHVEQYARLGVAQFATQYTVNHWVLENEAIDQANRVAQQSPARDAGSNGQQSATWAYFNVNGALYYGDANFLAYPADPSTGRVIGQPVGRMQGDSFGRFWIVDTFGRSFAAVRVR